MSYPRPSTASATCPTCQTDFERLPVEYDEDGGYAFLEVKTCADSTCGTLLCGCCAQFHCDGCGETFCADHLVSVPDGTDRPLHCCPECAAADVAELAADECACRFSGDQADASECPRHGVVLPMPPARETWTRVVREVA